jgi:hypothetical protein
MDRRNFLAGMFAAAVAPAFVRPSSLMRIKPIVTPDLWRGLVSAELPLTSPPGSFYQVMVRAELGYASNGLMGFTQQPLFIQYRTDELVHVPKGPVQTSIEVGSDGTPKFLMREVDGNDWQEYAMHPVDVLPAAPKQAGEVHTLEELIKAISNPSKP